MAPVSFQILSDLHLETHPSYYSFTFTKTAPNLALLGDVGHVANNQLFTFLEAQLNRYSVFFFLLGNHEPYHMSFKTAKSKMRAFQTKIDKRSTTMGKFVFLDQTRYDLASNLTILGCTLFSRISPKQDFAVESRMVDFRDILRWTTDDHNEAHQADLAWLNAQVSKMARDEPHRRIVVFLHHSPSLDPRCTDPRHAGSEVTTGFAKDLSMEECWTSSMVRAWAFGHTHYSCAFADERGKAVLSNQKGYYLIPEKAFDAERVFRVGE